MRCRMPKEKMTSPDPVTASSMFSIPAATLFAGLPRTVISTPVGRWPKKMSSGSAILDGIINNNYDPNTGAFLETINRADGTPLLSDGLYDMLVLGEGVYFTGGIADEEHGLF